MTKITADDGQSTVELGADTNFKAAVYTIFDGHDFSEEFKTKVANMVAGLVDAESNKRVQNFKESYEAETIKLTKELEEAFEEKIQGLQEQLTESTNTEELAEKLDNYISYAAETWMAENRIAVESGLRVQIAEEMLRSMAAVMSESMIVLDPSRVDAVARLEEEVADLEAKTTKLIRENRTLSKNVLVERKRNAIEEKISGLTDTQKEKIRPILEACDDVAEIESKVALFKESVAPNAKLTTVIAEDLTPQNPSNKQQKVLSEDENINHLANLI